MTKHEVMISRKEQRVITRVRKELALLNKEIKSRKIPPQGEKLVKFVCTCSYLRDLVSKNVLSGWKLVDGKVTVRVHLSSIAEEI